jgi:hypothetical protein
MEANRAFEEDKIRLMVFENNFDHMLGFNNLNGFFLNFS